MNKKNYFLLTALLLTLFFSCNNYKKDTFTYHKVIPAEFPQVSIPGFNFPEDSLAVNNWVRTSNTEKIYQHGWGIWTGLTTETNQYIPGDKRPLRVFETWLTPEEIVDSIKNVPVRRSNRANLKTPNQLGHFVSDQETVNDSIHESVSYSPGAASFAINNKIFMATTLLDYAKKENRKEVPFFPPNAITIKPVFKVLASSTGKTKFNIAAWSGPNDKLAGFPEQDWGSQITVDVSEGAISDGTTFNVDDFINYKLNDEDVFYFNKEFTENSGNKSTAQAGDYAILVGMHVGTREITNWTWQTFWWDSNPDNPALPSSKEIADLKPRALRGAATNYSMAVAYYMVNPNEPYEGSNITGQPNYAYNPYLEAGFGPGTFNDALSYVKTPEGKKINTYAGTRSNCMSCHRMASINPDALSSSNTSVTPYVGNSYVSRTDSLFKDQLLLDFAWSIQGNLDTLGIKSYLANLKK